LYQAFFKQKGIIRVEDIKEFEAELQLLSAGRLPAGNRVCVLASSGGSAVFLADKCASEGLDVAELQADTRRRLEDILPSFAATRNPVDMTSIILVQPGLLQKCADIVLNDPNIDSVLINHWVLYGGEDVLKELGAVHKKARKPLIVNVMGPELLALEAIRYLRDLGVPTISDAAYAARSLAKLAEYDSCLKRHRLGKDVYVKHIANKDAVKHEITKLRAGKSLSESEGKKMLASCGIPVVADRTAATADEATVIAREIGYPLVLKVDSPDIIHKTEAGGVKLNLQSPEEVRDAYKEIMEKAKDYNPNARIEGVSVQEMAPAGVEVIVGGKRDPVFGPTVLFGLGGVFVEVMRDVALRVAPLSKDDAADMIREIKGYKILEGVRGNPPADIGAIQDVILKVSTLLQNYPEISEIDINPLLVYPRGKGVKAVDALIMGDRLGKNQQS
ncbi:MAG TPA: acetate--CoA ligase family protein, partial [Clostridia bacterium]|nr:acetate--CoA ligase family protein [Clostridia bacterium]